jgi:hypothetical protein
MHEKFRNDFDENRRLEHRKGVFQNVAFSDDDNRLEKKRQFGMHPDNLECTRDEICYLSSYDYF